MEAELMCGVCLEYFDKPLMLPCTHNFCKKCIEGILLVNSRPSLFNNQQRQRLKYHLDCPLCQRSIELENGIETLPVNRILENIIEVHRKGEPLASNEAAWKIDSIVSDSPCLLHDSEPMSLYCLTCSRAVCKLCDCVTDKSSGTIHKCVPIKEQADQYQMKISNAIAEIKRKVVPINDEIQLLQDMMEQIKTNEESIRNQLESQVSGLIQSLKSKQEELTRQLHNDMMSIKRPIDEQLRKHTQLKKTVDDHLKRLNSIRITKDTGLRIKLMKESERQLNSLLCFDMPMFCSKDMPIVDMPVWEVDKESLLQSIHQLQWKKSGGTKTDFPSRQSSENSSRQSSREDDNVSSPRTPPVTFEPSPSTMSFTDNTVTRSTMTKKQKPRTIDPGSRKDQDNILPNIIIPNIAVTTSNNLTSAEQAAVSGSQPSSSNVTSTSFKISTQPLTATVTSNLNPFASQQKPNVTPTVPRNTTTGSKSTSTPVNWFSSTVVPSSEQTMNQAPPCFSQNSHIVQPPLSATPFSLEQSKSNVMSVTVPREGGSNIFAQQGQGQTSQSLISTTPPTPQVSRSDIAFNIQGSEKQIKFPIPRSSDFIPQPSTTSGLSGADAAIARGILRKPKFVYGSQNEINKSTLMAMVSDGGDIGMDTVIKSNETIRTGVMDDSNIAMNSSNIPISSGSNIRIDRRASTGTTNLPTKSNSFSTANLPTISARDFSPTPQMRTNSPNTSRKTLKPKKKISK